MTEEQQFIRYLRFDRGFWACDEVYLCGGIADVLAVDRRKQHIVEYEFKRSASDLYKDSSKQKFWMQKRAYAPQPHRFYYVLPEKLYYKCKAYLDNQPVGVVTWIEDSSGVVSFHTKQTCTTRKTNLPDYKSALEKFVNRLSSAYVRLNAQKPVKEITNEHK